MKKLPIERILWAFVLIAVGTIMLLNVTEVVDYEVWEIVGRLWPLFIIIPGVSNLLKGKLFWGSALIIGGGSFMLANFTDINVWQYVWPLLIISIGLSMLLKPLFKGINYKSKEDTLDETAVFGGVEKRIEAKAFEGGSVDAVFGGAEIDLSKATIAEDGASLEVNAVFGGVEVKVDSARYRVKSEGTGVFGAWINKSESTGKKTPVLEIKGAAVFGGVEIKEIT